MTDDTQSEANLPPRRIVLTGFMGSGKSTVGPLVAGRLGWKFLDVDEVIETEAGAPISALFARHGEAAFRDREHATITRLAAADGLVMALGGGAIERAETRELLLSGCGTLLVHLEVELATTLTRCAGTLPIAMRVACRSIAAPMFPLASISSRRTRWPMRFCSPRNHDNSNRLTAFGAATPASLVSSKNASCSSTLLSLLSEV